jgi:hypothetical protein
MRLVVANPRQVRLDGPIAAPGKVIPVPAIGRSPFAPVPGQHAASNDDATAHASPARSSFGCIE